MWKLLLKKRRKDAAQCVFKISTWNIHDCKNMSQLLISENLRSRKKSMQKTYTANDLLILTMMTC